MNTKKVRIIAVAIAVSLSGVVFLFGQDEPPTSEASDTAAVAIVNAESIPYSAIRVTPEGATIRFVLENGREPVTDADLRQVEQIRRRAEVAQLVGYIQEAIRARQISRMRIQISDAEIKQRSERLIREGDSPKAHAAFREKQLNLLDCLRAVHEDSQDADDVYNARLAEGMPPELWKAILRQYRTPEQRVELEELLNYEGDLDVDAQEIARFELRMEKLRRAIEEDLIRTDPEFAEYIRLTKTDPGNEKVQSKGHNYKTAKRDEWWQQRYREAKIEIVDERFEGALVQVLGPEDKKNH